MSEQPHEEAAQVEDSHAQERQPAAREPAHDEREEPTGGGPVERTGHPEVDDVLASLESLRDAPVSEHVEVFESAHDRLRGALADAGSDQAPS